MPLTQTQLATAVADRAELSKTDAKRALAALEEVVLEQLGNAEKVRIGGMVQLAVRVKPAQKKRKGGTPRPARRSCSPPSRRALICEHGRSLRRRRRCHRCRRHAGDSPPDTPLSAAGPRSQPPSGRPAWVSRVAPRAVRPAPTCWRLRSRDARSHAESALTAVSGLGPSRQTVSYTHLTLPTILLV